MVTAARLRDDAKALYEQPELPASCSFYDYLSPVNQRQFARDLWPVLAKAWVEGTPDRLAELVEFIEGWMATADLDSDAEATAAMRKPSVYRPFEVA